MTARRIASLLPSATEALFAIGAGPAVVGVTHECDVPLEATRLPALTSTRIVRSAREGETLAAAIDRQVHAHLAAGASLYDLDVERLATLQPDLIVTQALCDVCAVSYPLVEAIARALPVEPSILSLEPTSLADVYTDLRALGAATGHVAGAEAIVASMIARIGAVSAAVAGAPRKRVVLLEWTDPPYGGGHWAADLLERAGGEPHAAFPGRPSAVLTWDAIESADPEIVIVAPCGMDLPNTLAAIDALASERETWRAFAAARRIVALDGHRFVNRPGPSFAPTVELYAAALHPDRVPLPAPDAFREVRASAVR